MKTTLIVPDLHVPYQCPKFMRVILKLLKKYRFHRLCQIGDAVDLWQVSTYDKDPARRNTILDDIEEWNEILTKWGSLLYAGSEVHLLEGNHETRLARLVARSAREIHEIVKPMPELLKLRIRNETTDVKWIWHPYSKWDSCRFGDCTVMHGFYFNQHVAATNLIKYKTNVICGHVHRTSYVTDGTHYSATLGHGSDEKLTAHQPTPTGWTQSLGILTEDLDGKTSLEIITVKDGVAYVRGEKIKG